MRCGCPECGAFMIHAETSNACVCPDCLFRCTACQGAGMPFTREQAQAMKHANMTTEERMREMSKREEE